jgi:hypothetical protein
MKTRERSQEQAKGPGAKLAAKTTAKGERNRDTKFIVIRNDEE